MLGRWRPPELCEFQASLGCIVRLCLKESEKKRMFKWKKIRSSDLILRGGKNTESRINQSFESLRLKKILKASWRNQEKGASEFDIISSVGLARDNPERWQKNTNKGLKNKAAELSKGKLFSPKLEYGYKGKRRTGHCLSLASGKWREGCFTWGRSTGRIQRDSTTKVHAEDTEGMK